MITDRIWRNGPPPSIGWWPASLTEDIQSIRWWNGKWWSNPAYPCDNAEYAGWLAKQKSKFQNQIQWTEKWWEQPSKAIREAVEKHLWCGFGPMLDTSSYICYALDYWAGSSPEKQKVVNTVHCRIGRRLGSKSRTVRDWLIAVAKVPPSEITTERLQEYRKLWALHLANEYEQEGK